MKIDLSNVPLYVEDELNLNKRVTYFYGGNGTGKSTITKLLRAQCSGKYDTRIFQEFDYLIGEDKDLDAVVLGDENADIKKKIDGIEENIHTLE